MKETKMGRKTIARQTKLAINLYPTPQMYTPQPLILFFEGVNARTRGCCPPEYRLLLLYPVLLYPELCFRWRECEDPRLRPTRINAVIVVLLDKC